MIHEKSTAHPESHCIIVEMWDDFGHKHEVACPTHAAVEDSEKPFPAGPVKLVPVDHEPQMENIRKMMRDRELAFLEHCLSHPEHAQHPAVLAHPEHPDNKAKATVQPAPEKDCKTCG